MNEQQIRPLCCEIPLDIADRPRRAPMSQKTWRLRIVQCALPLQARELRLAEKRCGHVSAGPQDAENRRCRYGLLIQREAVVPGNTVNRGRLACQHRRM